MRTPRPCLTRQVLGGTYVHLGLKSGLFNAITEFDDVITHLEIQLNMDGMQVYSNSNMQLWPILCRIVSPKVISPFVVGVYCGNNKPMDVTEYLHDLVEELRVILTHGILDPYHVAVVIHSIVCDSPARAFIKQVKGHSGYFGCEYCVQKGVHMGTRMTFPSLSAPLRNDASFRTRQQPEHHIGTCPLIPLPLSLVHNFPPDYMHSVS